MPLPDIHTGQASGSNLCGIYEEYRAWRISGARHEFFRSRGVSPVSRSPALDRGSCSHRQNGHSLSASMGGKGFEVLCLLKIPLATAEITNKTLGLSVFMSVHAALPPALLALSHPHLAARHQIWETRGGGGWALRAASHGLSDLLTSLGLRPQCLPTLVNKPAPFKAVS